jgi:hypothetical protein
VSPPLASAWARRLGFHSTIDACIYALSVYGVPAVVFVATLVALIAWHSQDDAQNALPLSLAAIADPEAALTPAQAMGRLRGASPVTHHDTKLAETPFWFAFSAAPNGRAGRSQVELPSRHARQVECWNGATLEPLGSGDRSAATGQIKLVKAGFVLELDASVPVLCRGTFAGPARITAVQWPAADFAASVREFHRHAGLLEGGLLVLSAFVFLTAIINREWLYVLFAMWLVASLRLGAISAGWDAQ